MAQTPSEEISRYNTTSNGKTDANLANDSNHLGGVPAEDFATKQYVQNYHDTKEQEFDENISAREALLLQTAKGYTDTVVGNQDFSSFAKVTDVQALDSKLSSEMEAALNNCHATFDNKIAEVVSDTNANFEEVEASISTLNTSQQELFTSVSNGKSQVAAAITDQGVSTASDASFSTMAANIRAIDRGGGEYDDNWVNTGDATAESDDIMLGETAYVKGQKVYGSHTDLDTSDATATASDILSGASAYVDGEKIYGTYEPEEPIDTSDATATASDILYPKTAYVDGEKIVGNYVPLDTSDGTATANDIKSGKVAYVNGQRILGTSTATDYPTYGTDTTNATATAADIAAGKTAYIGGQYITGTFAGNSNVEEVYGPSAVGNINMTVGSIRLIKEQDTDLTVTQRDKYAFSKDNKYCVSRVRLSDGTYAIDSNMVTEDGLVVQASGGTLKKYRYTLEELGIPSDQNINWITMGAPGLCSSNSLCYLIICTYKSGNYYYHIYTYHLYENGVIGKESSSDPAYILSNYVIQANLDNTLLAANGNPQIFIAGGYKISLEMTPTSETQWDIIYSRSSLNYSSSGYQLMGEYLTPDDRFSVFRTIGNNNYGYIGIAYLDENYTVTSCCNVYSGTGHNSNFGVLIDITNNKLIYPRINHDYVGIKFRVFDIVLGANGSSISLENGKTVYAPYNGTDSYRSVLSLRNMAFSSDKSKVIMLCEDNNQRNYGIAIYNTADILNASDEDTITPSKIENISNNTGITTTVMGVGQSDTILVGRGPLYVLKEEQDSTDIVGIRYKGNLYKRVNSNALNAGAGDVLSGKTFIGYNGNVQTGTLTLSSST